MINRPRTLADDSLDEWIEAMYPNTLVAHARTGTRPPARGCCDNPNQHTHTAPTDPAYSLPDLGDFPTFN